MDINWLFVTAQLPDHVVLRYLTWGNGNKADMR